MTSSPLTSKNWFGKASAALILGFTFSIAITCLFALLFSEGDTYLSAQGQVAMWMMAPLWSLILSFCFFFRTPLRAWSWLFAANIVAWALYAAARQFLI